jgi:hypothetical protein
MFIIGVDYHPSYQERFKKQLRLESERSWMMSEMPCIRSLL